MIRGKKTSKLDQRAPKLASDLADISQAELENLDVNQANLIEQAMRRYDIDEDEARRRVGELIRRG